MESLESLLFGCSLSVAGFSFGYAVAKMSGDPFAAIAVGLGVIAFGFVMLLVSGHGKIG